MSKVTEKDGKISYLPLVLPYFENILSRKNKAANYLSIIRSKPPKV
mgnify:CR=1 FL=1